MRKRSLASFSLRTLLIVMTLIGVVAWWLQRPKTVLVAMGADANAEKVCGPRPSNGVWDVAFPERFEHQTFRRTNFVNLVRDGETIVRDKQQNVIQIQRWHEGTQVACEYFFRDPSGGLWSHGRTLAGRPHGTWEWYAGNDANRMPSDWKVTTAARRSQRYLLREATPVRREGNAIKFVWNSNSWTTLLLKEIGKTQWEMDERIDEQASLEAPSEPTHRFEFDRGKLVGFDGKPADDFLWRMPDDDFTRSLLERITVCNMSVHDDFSRGALSKLLSDTNYFVDSIDRSDALVSLYHGAPLPHAASLYMLLRTNDLALDYRFGHYVVTSVEKAKAWQDKTNVANLFTSDPAYQEVLQSEIPVRDARRQYHPLYHRPRHPTLGDLVDSIGANANWDSSAPLFEFIFVPPGLESEESEWPAKSARIYGDKSHCFYWSMDRPISIRDVLGTFLDQNRLSCSSASQYIAIEEQQASTDQ